ncbi:MAG: methylmalonyl-CoA mutase family protein, partial [Candidatus Lindowbacteria bacterium]|nr:methylmalonyl-CoA mutase family protein [Candidatus Lindowbacteria bacterium]
MSDAAFRTKHKVRFVTATSLFDGHDAAIHIMRRILQDQGAEVIHLGHDRSVEDVVTAAIQEDVQGIAVSSYQGGHIEYFSYMLDLLKKRGRSDIRVYGGGGGVIVPAEIELLHKRGVSRIFSPNDGAKIGLIGIARHMLRECDNLPGKLFTSLPVSYNSDHPENIARMITTLEYGTDDKNELLSKGIESEIHVRLEQIEPCPIIGFTGTGGAGKSTLVDEVLLRFTEAFPELRVAILCVDPTRSRTGGALLGDRIRMNALQNQNNFFLRSMATRRPHLATSKALKDTLSALQVAEYDLIILETAGIGQSDSEVTELADLCVYVMTPEYGAPTQLEKIDMLDLADLVVVNKFDKTGSLDALREVRKNFCRNRHLFTTPLEKMPVYGTTAHRFGDLGTNTFFNALFRALGEKVKNMKRWNFSRLPEGEPTSESLIPDDCTRYLAEIIQSIRDYHSETEQQMQIAERAEACRNTLKELGDSIPAVAELIEADEEADQVRRHEIHILRDRYNDVVIQLSEESRNTLRHFSELQNVYREEEQVYRVRGQELSVKNFSRTLGHLNIPKVCIPQTKNWAEQLRYSRLENTPGRFPYTAGVFEFKRQDEDPLRMFAGEGTAERTNHRFHYLSKKQKAIRLSTAFDSVTLYGSDPGERPDIYGKIGNAGVSICSLDDAKRLFSGFDLCTEHTSVSMTINGPAPTVLAFFLNAAIDAACERKLRNEGRWQEVEKQIDSWFAKRQLTRPVYRSDALPPDHDGSGLGFLGVPADMFMDQSEYNEVKSTVLTIIRGT